MQLRFGLTPWNFNQFSAAGLSEQASFAEALGYRSFWLPENHFNERAIPDPLMLLAAVAAATQSILLATTSYLLPLRHPLLAAEQVAVLDRLSNGRVLLGIGRGYSNPVLQAFNVLPSDKRAQFEHVLEVMIKAWSGAPLATDDKGATVVLDPLPVQKPHPPLWVAAFGPKALAQVGRLGLPYLASPIESLAELKSNYAVHAAAVANAGKAPISTVPIMRTMYVSNDANDVRVIRERVANAKTATGKIPSTALDDWAIIGEPNFAREKLAEYQETLGMTETIVTRLRLDGVEQTRLKNSLERIIDL